MARRERKRLDIETKNRLYELIIQRGEGGKSFREVAETFGIEAWEAEKIFYEVAKRRFELLDGEGDALLSFVVDKLMALEAVWQGKAHTDVKAAELVRSLLRDLSNLLDLQKQRKPILQIHASVAMLEPSSVVRAELERLTKEIRALPQAEPVEIIEGVVTEVEEEQVPANDG